MASPAIDYAALAEQARQSVAPKVDYSALAEQARTQTPEAPSQVSDLVSHAWNQFSGAVTGTIAALHHPIEALSTEKQRSADLLGKAADAWKQGDKGAALDFAAEAVPVLGTLNKQTQQEFLKGRYGAGFGDLLGFFGAAKLGEKAPALVKGAAETVPKAAEALSGALKTPGTAQIIAGAGEVMGGAAALPHEPIGGLATAAYGVRQIGKGLTKRRAALAEKLANAQAATQAAKDTAAAASRPPDVQPMTPQIDTSTEPTPEMQARIDARQAAAPAVPSLPVRVTAAPPGYVGQGAPAPETVIPAPATPAAVPAAATSVPAATEPVKTIPFKQAEIPKEVYEGAARAEKVKAWADLFEQHGIDAEDVKLMAEHTPTSAIGKQLAQLAEASGLKIPSLKTTEQIVTELRARKTKLSPQMERKLKLSGAMPTAENLRDIMALESATKQ